MAFGRKSAPVEDDHELFGFPDGGATAIVAPIHGKLRPAILTTPEEVHVWFAANPKALEVQAPRRRGAITGKGGGNRPES